jgi:hypothetical protein
MKKQPDALTLDEMLLGFDEDHHKEGWQHLVGESGGARAWEQAVERRRRVDQAAQLGRRFPWMIPALQSLNKVRRLAQQWPERLPSIQLPDDRRLLTAQLGPDSSEVPSQPEALEWGCVVVLYLPVGARIALTAASEQLSCWYMTSQGGGPLPTRTWRMESGEAPVLLLASLDLSQTTPWIEVISAHHKGPLPSSLAGLVLLEKKD